MDRDRRHTHTHTSRGKKADGCLNIYSQFVNVLCSPLPDWTHVLEEERRRRDNEERGKGGMVDEEAWCTRPCRERVEVTSLSAEVRCGDFAKVLMGL